MDKPQAQRLINRLHKEGYDAKLYEDYSGRGMFGKTTFGVVTNKVFTPKSNISRDNMALEYIYY